MSVNIAGSIDSDAKGLITAAVGSKQLGDASVGPAVFTAKASLGVKTVAEGINFGFNAQGNVNVNVNVFNSNDDVDRLGVLGLPEQPQPNNEGISFASPLKVDYPRDKVVIKTALLGQVSGNISGAASGVSFGIEAAKTVEFIRYNSVARQTLAFNAILNELTNFDSAIDVADILQLQTGQALAYRLSGTFNTSVAVSWADIFLGNINALANTLKQGELLAIDITTVGSANLKVGISGDFLVAFTREQNGKIRISVKKAASRSLGLGIDAGIQIGFKNPDALSAAINQVINSIAGDASATIDKVFAAPDMLLSDLNSTEQQLIRELAKRLGLEPLVDTLNSIRQKWQEIKNKVPTTIQEIVKAKIGLMFQASYARLKETATILEVIVAEALVAEHHRDLLLGNIDPLLDKIRANTVGYELVRYFYQEVLTIMKSWGLMLSLGKLQLGGKDSINERRVITKNINDEQQISYTGSRMYQSTWFKDRESWIGTFKAEMDSYLANPTTADFRYGLAIESSWQENTLSEDELRDFLDNAQVWQVIDGDDIQKIVNSHKTQLAKKAICTLSFKADDVVFKKLLADFANLSDDQLTEAIARAFAASMPRLKDYPVRASVPARTSFYAPLWKAYLKNPSLSLDNYASTAKQFVSNNNGGSALQLLESFRDAGGNYLFGSYVWIIHVDGTTVGGGVSGIADKWQKFKAGMKQLHQVSQAGSGKDYKEIEKIFDQLSPFWSQSFYLRAIGALWATLARQGGYLAEIEANLKLEFPDSADAKEFVCTAAK
jgi:hypothetical protein